MNVEECCKQGQKALLKKASGWPYCIRTTPMARHKAFVSSMKGVEKSDKASTGACVIACLRLSKAV